MREMERGYDQIERIRRLQPRVDSGDEADPTVIFDVQQLPAVVEAFLRVGDELATLRTRFSGDAEVRSALALWEPYREELGVRNH
jgi:hypothetical protein